MSSALTQCLADVATAGAAEEKPLYALIEAWRFFLVH
jgi:hypothetical protein